MPSLADIPEIFHSADSKYLFLNWLSRLPVDPHVKRALINFWSQEYNVRVSSAARSLVNRGDEVPVNV